MTKFNYKPLPKGVTIGNSKIQGGFINHALKPNCELVENGSTYILRTIRNILPQEELTVRYSIEQ